MPYTGGTISKAISASDVASAIGQTSKPYVINSMNVKSTINPYSKHKPMEFNKVTELSADDKKSINYGYLHPNPMTGLQLVKFVINGTIPTGVSNVTRTGSNMVSLFNGWYYQKPTTWMRYGDWNGYMPNVGDTMFFFETLEKVNIASDSSVVSGDIIPLSIDSPYGQCVPNDFGATVPETSRKFSQLYFSLIVVKNTDALTDASSRFGLLVGGSNTDCSLSGASGKATFKSLFKNGVGTYYIIPCMAISDNPSGVTQKAFIPLPCNVHTCEVVNQSAAPIPTAYVNANWTATATNVSVTKTNGTVRFYLTLKGSLKSGASNTTLTNLYATINGVSNDSYFKSNYISLETSTVGTITGQNQTIINNKLYSKRLTDLALELKDAESISILLYTTSDYIHYYLIASTEDFSV